MELFRERIIPMNKKWNWLLIAAALFFTNVSKAEVIELPEDELATETVTPIYDRPDVVKNRNIVTEKKFELGGYLGWNTTEPIYNQGKFGLNVGYHWSERSAIVFNYAQWLSGLNTFYTDGLRQDPNNLDFDRAPKKKYSVYGHYEWKLFYGKISLGKHLTSNTSTYPIFGLGMTAYEHKNFPGLDFGIGQKFYFNKYSALRIDLKMQVAQQVSPFLGDTTAPYNNDKSVKVGNPIPEPSDFKERWGINTILDVGVSAIF